jgi:sugar phosphate isomerase/epimerase
MEKTRRNFLKLTGMSLPALMIQPGKSRFSTAGNPLDLGIASYSFRNYDLDKTINMTRRLGIPNLALKSMHMPLEMSDDEIKQVKKKINDAGINLYGAGVIYMNNEEEVKNAFRYAKAAGLSVIIGVPKHELLDITEQHVKATGIKVAIHNHGPGDEVYPSPESIYEKIKDRDARIGICLDIGHTERIGLSPAAEAKKYFTRLLDVHIKDVDKSTAEGDTVEIGRGVIDIPAFLKVLIDRKYPGVVSFEYEKDADDIMPGIAESIGYVRGVIKTLG